MLSTPARRKGRGRGRAALVALCAAWSMAPGMEALAQSCASKPPKDVIIAVDVGHVARRPGDQCTLFKLCSWGATSARGVPEYDFNLRLAQDVREELVRAGYPSTMVLTTDLRGQQGLYQRAARANAAKADVFLSIHHDAVRDRFVKKWEVEGVEHNYYDDARGFSLHVSHRLPDSLKLARLVSDEMLKAGLSFTTHHEPRALVGASAPYADAKRGIYWRDRLVVLTTTRMPAVLVEAGVILNRDEEVLLASEAHRQTIASAVARAVTQFCRPVIARANEVKRVNARRRNGN